jgi:hypothetical protein
MATRALCLVGLLLCLLQLFQQAAADTYGRATYYWDNNQVITSMSSTLIEGTLSPGGTGNSLTMHSTAVCPSLLLLPMPAYCCLLTGKLSFQGRWQPEVVCSLSRYDSMAARTTA